MTKLCLTYRAVLGNLGLPIRKHDVAPASRQDFMPNDHKVDMDVWHSWQIAVRGW